MCRLLLALCLLYIPLSETYSSKYWSPRVIRPSRRNPTALKKWRQQALSDQLPEDIRTGGNKVHIDLTAFQLVNVDPHQEEFTLELEVQYRWKDSSSAAIPILNLSQLKWYPAEWSWGPLTPFGIDMFGLDEATGEYYLTKSYSITARFIMDVSQYPFDSHTLKLTVFFIVPQTVARMGGVLDDSTATPQQLLLNPKSVDGQELAGASGWIVSSIVRQPTYYCFPVQLQAEEHFDLEQHSEAPPEGSWKERNCVEEYRVGIDLSLGIQRKGGLIFTLILPSLFVGFFSFLQLQIDTKYFGARNQIPTIGLMSITTLMVGTDVPMTGKISWYEVYSLVIIGHIFIIITINVIVHQIQRKGREKFSRLFDKAAGVFLPGHMVLGQVCIVGTFFSPKVKALWITIWVLGFIIGAFFCIGWLLKASTRNRIIAERLKAEQSLKNGADRDKAIIEAWKAEASNDGLRRRRSNTLDAELDVSGIPHRNGGRRFRRRASQDANSEYGAEQSDTSSSNSIASASRTVEDNGNDSAPEGSAEVLRRRSGSTEGTSIPEFNMDGTVVSVVSQDSNSKKKKRRRDSESKTKERKKKSSSKVAKRRKSHKSERRSERRRSKGLSDMALKRTRQMPNLGAASAAIIDEFELVDQDVDDDV